MSRWPAMMRRKTAAEYLDMSEVAFEREIASGRLPSGILLGGRLHWRRDALDKALDHATGEVSTDYESKFWERRRGQVA